MKVLICYHDNDDTSLHKTLRITVPGSWKTKSTTADLLNQFITAYNAYHRKKVLSVEDTHLATRHSSSPSGMSVLGEEMIQKNNAKKNIDDDGSTQYCYVSFANDTKIVNTGIRDRTKLYVRHNIPEMPSTSNSTTTESVQVEYEEREEDDHFGPEILYNVVDESKEKPWLQKIERTETRDEVELVPPVLSQSVMKKTRSSPIGTKKGLKSKETARALSPRKFANTMYGLNLDDNDNDLAMETSANAPVSIPQVYCEAAPTNYGDRDDDDSEDIHEEEDAFGDEILYSVVDENKDKPWLQKLERTETRDEVEILPPILPTSMRKSLSLPSAAHGITSKKAGPQNTRTKESARALSPRRPANNGDPPSFKNIAAVTPPDVSAKNIGGDGTASTPVTEKEIVSAPIPVAAAAAATAVTVTATAVAVTEKPIKIDPISPNSPSCKDAVSTMLGRAIRPRSRSMSPRKIFRNSAEAKATAKASNALSTSLHSDQTRKVINNSDLTSKVLNTDQTRKLTNNINQTRNVSNNIDQTRSVTNGSSNTKLSTINKDMKKSRNILSFLLKGKKKNPPSSERTNNSKYAPLSTNTSTNTQQKSPEMEESTQQKSPDLDAFVVTVNDGSKEPEKSDTLTGVEVCESALPKNSIERYDGGDFAAEMEPSNIAPTFRRTDSVDSMAMGQSFGTAYSMEELSRFKTFLKRSGVVEDVSMFDDMVHEMKVKNGESNSVIKKRMQNMLKESFRNAMLAIRNPSTAGDVTSPRRSAPIGSGLDTIIEDTSSHEKEPNTNTRKAPLIIDTADTAAAAKDNKNVDDDKNSISGGTHLNRDIYVDSSGSLVGSSLVSPTQWIVPSPYPNMTPGRPGTPVGPIRNAVNNLCGVTGNFPRLLCKNGNEDDIINDEKKLDFVLVNEEDDVRFFPTAGRFDDDDDDDETALREKLMFDRTLPAAAVDAQQQGKVTNGNNDASDAKTKNGGLDNSQHTLAHSVKEFCNDAVAAAAVTGAIIQKKTNMYMFPDGSNWEDKFASRFEVCGCTLSTLRNGFRL
jgi:hypothetical protein